MGIGRTTLGPTRWLCHVGVAQARRRGALSRSGAEDLSLQPLGRDSSALGNTLHRWVWGLHGRIVFLDCSFPLGHRPGAFAQQFAESLAASVWAPADVTWPPEAVGQDARAAAWAPWACGGHQNSVSPFAPHC